MSRKQRWAFGGGVVLLALTLAAPLAQGQALKDTVIHAVHLSIKPPQASAWLQAFKKHLDPTLQELQEQGALLDYHLLVPGVHHPGYKTTHMLVLVYKDRASQGAVAKKLQEVFAELPPEAAVIFSASDPAKHYDDEWLEIDLEKVEVPAEEEEKKEEAQE